MARERRTDADRRARQAERLGRILRVLRLISGRGGPWDAAAIAKELEVSERTVFRDLACLEAANFGVFFDEQAGGYRIRPGFELGTAGDTQPPPSAGPEELADASFNAARQLLSGTQHLVDLLDRLRNALRPRDEPPAAPPPHRRRPSS